MAHWFPGHRLSDSSDWDVISETPIQGTEWHDPDLLLNSQLSPWVSDHVIDFSGHQLKVVNPIGLALIKRSHLWRSLGFAKHMMHWTRWLRSMTRHFGPAEWDYLYRRTIATQTKYPEVTPSLKKTVDEFFDDYVVKKYSHDLIHQLVAYYDQPLYTRLQKDPNVVWCSHDLWFALSEEDRDRTVSEEAMTLAIERFMVPKNWDYSPRIAYIKCLERVCTNIASGWFRDHAIDRFHQILCLYDRDRILNTRQHLEGK